MKYSTTKYFEGCKLTTYICPAGKPTIGWGHTGADVKHGMTITQQQADELLVKDMKIRELAVVGMVSGKVDLKEHELEALADFAYNKGITALKSSTLMRLLLAGKKEEAANEFLKWNKADGTHNKKDDDGDGLIDEPGEKQTLKGLTNRGIAQRKLFLGL